MKSKFPKGLVKLERALSKLGFASRTQTLKLLKENKILINGKVKSNPNFLVNPDKDLIQIDGRLIKKNATEVVLFHKPKGFVTTKSDNLGRRTIFDLLPEFKHLHPVGRLDRQALVFYFSQIIQNFQIFSVIQKIKYPEFIWFTSREKWI